MLHPIRAFLKRPLAEDFSLSHQFWGSVQAGLYVFLFVYLFGHVGGTDHFSRLTLLVFFGSGVTLTTFLANYVVPSLLSGLYNDERWTVGRQIVHVLFVLFCVSAGNQLVLLLTHTDAPPFWQMYGMVTVIGFFPITVGVFVAEQRRLKRNLARARTLTTQLDKLHQPGATPIVPELPKGVVLTSETGKETLSLLPNQLVYLESVGNYVEVYWLNLMFPQKTVLRSTLKEMEAALQDHPQFFRCHRAFIVNLKAVHKADGNARGYQLTMSGSGKLIPVSRGYVGAFDTRMDTLV